ncbi:hypothetical protein ERHA55_29500 [Erwinia rhapontici]|uniref:Protein CopB n=1 Tax=Erwinia rhapontici TaxID=55212 RepID=A0ABN6DKT6_ERWRD|nr:hypothetical protein [Erwinia rhapontici]BCQ35279.1 hypothetical protein ERHA53_26220 [Erwinia rhapontici]BCQ45423.1 hypothetical protein ERHA55_29500 [Erwinia rhapontici]
MKEIKSEKIIVRLTPTQEKFLQDLAVEKGLTSIQKVIYELIDRERILKG